MISRLEGLLEHIDEDGTAELRVGDVWYAVHVPGCDRQHWSSEVNRTITVHTLQYFEGSSQGGNLQPRLIAFRSARDRAFFELFTTVKNVGNRKALRALQLPFGRIAEAIAARDAKLLQSLPEIGKRSAETIIAELSGKVDRYITVDIDEDAPTESTGQRSLAHEALAVLTTLGEPRLEMMQLIDRVLAADASVETADELVSAVYRLRELPV